MSVKLIFEQSRPEVRCNYMPTSDVPDEIKGPSGDYLRKELNLPQVSEPEVMRHFINLSALNHHVDKGFYPLGSCTMKYNPKVNDQLAAMVGFGGLHPYQSTITTQGAMKLMHWLEKVLAEITGLSAVTLQPVAGSHGEMTGLFVTAAYHRYNGSKRSKVLVPDSAHGTNPASIILAGWEPIAIPSNHRGRIDLNALKGKLNEEVAALMVTNPNTLGLFEQQIKEVAKAVHDVGALLYMDGANLNALCGLARPGDMGFDIVHMNLHKTFSTPHGGGGPGSGPVGVRADLEQFLPIPRIKVRENGQYDWDYHKPHSIGKVHGFYGNYGMLVRAAAYIRSLGADGLKRMSQMAILNANYVRSKLEGSYKLDYEDLSMHEVVFSADNQGKFGIKAVDIAKRLLDFNIHAPTINFPLIVHEALMIEPTETETLDTLNHFCDVMLRIDEEARSNPEMLHNAPQSTPVSRFNEAAAARNLDIVFKN